MYARSIAVAILVLVASTPAWADECSDLMKEIDDAMVETQMDLDDTDKVHKLRDKGEKLHEDGDHDEAIDALKEAREIIASNQD
ncbi:MAG: hypothetical protein ACOCP9_07110 [Halofilum sp. (in: g-proteobacteria)]